jgi:hypothetical protein
VFEKLGDYWFTVGDIETHVNGMSDKWLRTQLDKLFQYELLKKENQEEGNSCRKHIVYSKVGKIDFVLPKRLCDCMDCSKSMVKPEGTVCTFSATEEVI